MATMRRNGPDAMRPSQASPARTTSLRSARAGSSALSTSWFAMSLQSPLLEVPLGVLERTPRLRAGDAARIVGSRRVTLRDDDFDLPRRVGHRKVERGRGGGEGA